MLLPAADGSSKATKHWNESSYKFIFVDRECARSCMNLHKTGEEGGRGGQEVVPFEMVVLDTALQVSYG